MTPRLCLALRLLLAAIWLYNGLILKLWLVDPEHLRVVEAVGGLGSLGPAALLRLIGGCETALGLGILSGIAYTPVCWFQLGLVLLMNAVGIASGGVRDGAHLIATNLPLLMCMVIAARCGPGGFRTSSDGGDGGA